MPHSIVIRTTECACAALAGTAELIVTVIEGPKAVLRNGPIVIHDVLAWTGVVIRVGYYDIDVGSVGVDIARPSVGGVEV